MKHVIAYEQAGAFAGRPANNGLWCWGGHEILVGLTVGGFCAKRGHNIVEPHRSLLARSIGGGKTWTTVRPEVLVRRKVSGKAWLNGVR